jgi:hypothetical protein
MYSLAVIKSLNSDSALRKRETLRRSCLTRDCSHAESRGGVVLHSAAQRSTVFLVGARARTFLAKVLVARGGPEGQPAYNRLVESYF